MSDQSQLAQATFAAGCFWGVEAGFRKLPGVQDAICGYTGGSDDQPNYKSVCTGTTGHAEAVLVTYDPNTITYQQLLDAFFHMHDATQLNRQGPDHGTQYRSAIFYHSDDQHQQAQATIDALQQSDAYSKPICTQVAPAAQFHKAEEYHQRYFEKNNVFHCSMPTKS